MTRDHWSSSVGTFSILQYCHSQPISSEGCHARQKVLTHWQKKNYAEVSRINLTLLHAGHLRLLIDKNREVCTNVHVLYCYVLNNRTLLRTNVC